MSVASILKILHLNKIGFLIMVTTAFVAMFFTLFFALQSGIKSYKIILLRTGFSFAFFAIIGYFLALYFEKLFLSDIYDSQQNNEQEQTMQTNQLSVQTNPDEVDVEQNEITDKDNLDIEDDSFDKVVIVNKDSDN